MFAELVEQSAPRLQSLYVAPSALEDYCDSSGCLPGQIPLPGLKPKSVISKSAELTMNQVIEQVFFARIIGWIMNAFFQTLKHYVGSIMAGASTCTVVQGQSSSNQRLHINAPHYQVGSKPSLKTHEIWYRKKNDSKDFVPPYTFFEILHMFVLLQMHFC